ncbi:MAG: pyrophosphohydrolase domain-containing protein [Candidatus Amoebophilus sp.]
MEEVEYVERLKDKLLEEAQEVVGATSKASLQEELADLLEVIHAMCLAHKLPYEAIEATRHKKKAKKGGFETRIYSELVEMEIDNPSITYYLDNSDKYPELS